MYRIIFIFCLHSFYSIVSFSQIIKNGKTELSNNYNIPYLVATGYNVNRTFGNDSTVIIKLTKQTEFDSIFGKKIEKGSRRIPTVIDFMKYNVIALIKPSSYLSYKLTPVILQRKGEEIYLECNGEYGLVSKLKSRAFVLLIVDKKYNGNLKFYIYQIIKEKDETPTFEYH